jgi:hypothetical protein
MDDIHEPIIWTEFLKSRGIAFYVKQPMLDDLAMTGETDLWKALDAWIDIHRILARLRGEAYRALLADAEGIDGTSAS